jgi:hypothetical protein
MRFSAVDLALRAIRQERRAGSTLVTAVVTDAMSIEVPGSVFGRRSYRWARWAMTR